MGSSKKHKEKDREREHKHKKRKRSRSRSRSYEKKVKKSQHDKVLNDSIYHLDKRDDHKYKRGDNGSLPHDSVSKNELHDSGHTEQGQSSLTIEETNKLRAKLGLKPLQVNREGDVASKKDQDVHVPAINLGDVVNTEKLRDKMRVRQDRRKINDKLRSVKGLGEGDSCDESALSWVKKSRKLNNEKEIADKRAKMLEEMDAEFGIGNLVETEFDMESSNKYSSGDLGGLTVEHGIDKFVEGSNVILTLKDKGILDEDMDDILINVNIVDDEHAKKNVDNKSKRPNYKPYDEAAQDDYGTIKMQDVLSKYDEEIYGDKKDTIVLGSGGKYNAEHERNIQQFQSQLRQQSQSLNTPLLTLAREFFTQEEMDEKASFKKVKKKSRKIRKKEVLKADDLLPLPDNAAVDTSRYAFLGASDNEGKGGSDLASCRASDGAVFYTGIMPAGHESAGPAEITPSLHTAVPALRQQCLDDTSLHPAVDNGDDLVGPDEDLSGVAVEEEALQQELAASLNKARNLQQSNQRRLSVQKVVECLVKQKELTKHIAPSDKKVSNSGEIILNSMSEFCRSVGEIPTYGLAGNRDEEREEILDLELEMMERRKQEQEMEEQASGWAEVDIDTNPVYIAGDEKSVLEEEPLVTESIGSALKLAMKKGFLEKESSQRSAAIANDSSLQAQNYSIEDKRYDDLDEKYRKRDRYAGGMVTDFKDKTNYKPDILLEYVDESGRALNPKEAFRQLSHRFHGKGSGKRKTEKRQKKVEEDQLMKHMSSTDTPLNTLSMLKHKQRSEKSPFVILTGNRTFSASSQTLSKHR